MTRAEVLEALRYMTTEERLEVIEVASKLIREDIAVQSQVQVERESSLAQAVEAMRSYCEETTEHGIFAEIDTLHRYREMF